MKKDVLTEINNGNRKAYRDYLSTFPFEWFLTLRLPSPNYSFYLKKFRDEFLRAEHG